ncbi:hypothetical protein VTL71DRAFT_16573 [Oculimacula yallundae]|uniref:Uncharacterized protein n=1 Tax=Oculimacula yallundae TaxID=86028 RepID=A0ABR4CEV2_9HELO
MNHEIPTSHSCRICQRLVIDLGEKNDAWVERTLALRYEPHASEKARQGRQAFCELMTLRDGSQEHTIHIPANEIIFDFSMGELREAVDDHCLLLRYLKTGLLESDSPGPGCQPSDDYLLACFVDAEDLTFFTTTKSKVIQASSVLADEDSMFVMDPGSAWYHSKQTQTSLEVCVPAGEYEIAPWPIDRVLLTLCRHRSF